MKYSQLKQRVADYLNKSNLKGMIPSFIDYGQDYLESELRLEPMIALQDIDIAQGVQSFLEPDLFLEMIGARMVSDTSGHDKFQPLSKKEWEHFLLNKLPSADSGMPKLYARINIVETTDQVDDEDVLPDTGIDAITARSFLFDRPTDKDYILQYSFYRKEAKLAADSSTNWWLANAEKALIFAALKEASIYLANGDPRKDIWKIGLENALEELENNDNKARRGGETASANVQY